MHCSLVWKSGAVCLGMGLESGNRMGWGRLVKDYLPPVFLFLWVRGGRKSSMYVCNGEG